MHRLRGILLALALACGLLAQVDGSGRARALLEESGCQTSLPGQELADGAPSPSRPRGGERRRPAGPRGDGLQLSLPACGVNFAQVLLWLGVGVAVLLLVAALLRGRLGPAERRAAPKRVHGNAAAPPPPAEAVGELPDHARLAAAGDFAAAVHALLVHGIAAWLAAGGEAPRHATARDLLRRAQRRRTAAEPLAQLVLASERVHFGGRAADRALYDSSRDALQRWEAACPSQR